MTVGFTDLEGFTEFTAREGDEAASRLLVDHHRVVGPLVRSRGGRIVKRLGDGLLLTFPEPAAGVMAALELVDAEPAPLRLRAGLHSGSVVVLKDDVIGHVVNVAARVAEAASGGEVLVTKSIVTTAADDLPRATFGDATPTAFKGIDERLAVCRAMWATAPA
jgi:adenylate cyclase